MCLKELARAFGDWIELTKDRRNCRALENVNILPYVVEFCDHMTELHLPKEGGVNGLLSVINRFCTKFQYSLLRREATTHKPANRQFSRYIYIYIYIYIPRRNGPDFGRVFLLLKYTDITQNTYVQS